jgi:hypothetical protein
MALECKRALEIAARKPTNGDCRSRCAPTAKSKRQSPTLTRRTFHRIATWERGAKRSNRIAKEAHADRPVVRGERLFDVFRPHNQSSYARVAGRSEAALAVGSTLTAFPASSQYTPAERSGLFLKAEGEPR